jgi:hypothetical protein
MLRGMIISSDWRNYVESHSRWSEIWLGLLVSWNHHDYNNSAHGFDIVWSPILGLPLLFIDITTKVTDQNNHLFELTCLCIRTWIQTSFPIKSDVDNDADTMTATNSSEEIANAIDEPPVDGTPFHRLRRWYYYQNRILESLIVLQTIMITTDFKDLLLQIISRNDPPFLHFKKLMKDMYSRLISYRSQQVHAMTNALLMEKSFKALKELNSLLEGNLSSKTD